MDIMLLSSKPYGGLKTRTNMEKNSLTFADLIEKLDQTNKTNNKVKLLATYFQLAPDEEKIRAIALFTGRKPAKPVNSSQLRKWAIESAGIPDWLFLESYHSVGDLAETISLLSSGTLAAKYPMSLVEMFSEVESLKDLPETIVKERLISIWGRLDRNHCFIFNKLLTGSFRIGVSQSLIIQALAKASGKEKTEIAYRLTGNWNYKTCSYHELITSSSGATDFSKPYPFFLAYPVDKTVNTLGSPDEFSAEWKWDGIRSQVIKRNDEIYIWSRGEELVTEKFPEIVSALQELPNGTVLDGEILAFSNKEPLPFSVLQKRIGRKNLSKKMLSEAPVGIILYDILEIENQDIRLLSYSNRRAKLEKLIQPYTEGQVSLSSLIPFNTWADLIKLHAKSRDMKAEGFMIKNNNSPYLDGRKKGYWWKWKVEPYTADAVLIYAQKGHGKRSDLFTDYTFAIWNGEELCPFAKAYSGLNDVEIKEVDRFIRKNTKEKFGPVRTVKPELVFEIAFEGIQKSNRHKCGLAVRFPRIARWRKDKPASEADRLENLQALLQD